MYLAAVGSVALAATVLEVLGPGANGPTAAQILLLVLLLDARFCGTRPALVASVCAILAFWRYFTTPTGFAFGDPNDWAALLAFVTMSIVVGELASRAERRATEAQQSRQEIARLYQELEAAFERASEAEAAKRNEELKAALLDALTHNLRTPLTAIKAAVTALISAHGWSDSADISREGRQELLEVIDEESDRLNRFIEGLSTPEHREADQPLSLRSARVEDVVRAGVARAESLTRDHVVVVAIDEGLPSLSVDGASIIEVLYILLDNASKYSPAGTAIRVVAAMSESEHYVRLSIADEGPGIPLELRDRVFEKFFRIPSREPRDARRVGVGLGLPIARRLVETQAGKIWVETPSSNRGTLVAMTLPATADAPHVDRLAAVMVNAR